MERDRRPSIPQLPLSLDEGIALIRERVTELRESILALGQEDESTLGPMGWTGADHLMHLDAWHRRLLRWMADEAAGRRVMHRSPDSRSNRWR